ncbi:MAG TPA: extracellular solute-binding protein, partial [Propionibacteriaceae bacterium]|nr:extracellular solute-binding protein [Propionibacteriaceae bacterium]
EVTWPEPGAVAIYGPIALARHSADSSLAKDFISYVISQDGQQELADAGSYPTRPGVGGPEIPTDAPIAYPDWKRIANTKDVLLKDYQTIFGN